jgi:hypothetical protein
MHDKKVGWRLPHFIIFILTKRPTHEIWQRWMESVYEPFDTLGKEIFALEICLCERWSLCHSKSIDLRSCKFGQGSLMLATFHDLHIDRHRTKEEKGKQGKESMQCGRHEDESLKHGKKKLHCINLFCCWTCIIRDWYVFWKWIIPRHALGEPSTHTVTMVKTLKIHLNCFQIFIYRSTLANATLIRLFSEMLKFSKKLLLPYNKNIIVNDNSDYY